MPAQGRSAAFSPQPAPSGAAWSAVARWPGLSAPAKLAWFFIAEQSRGGREAVSVSSTMIGEAQGTSSDAGKRCLDSLLAEQLVDRLDYDRKSGRHLLALADPFAVIRARPLDWDGQRLLSFACQDAGPELKEEPIAPDAICVSLADRSSAADSPPSDAPHQAAAVPRSADPLADPRVEPRTRHLHLGLNPHAHPLSISLSPPLPILQDCAARQEEITNADRGTTRGSATPQPRNRGPVSRDPSGERSPHATAATADPAPLSQTLTLALSSLPAAADPATRHRRIQDYAAQISAEVNCANLFPEIAHKAAAAVIDGRLDQTEIDGILRRINKLRTAGTLPQPSRYFVVSLRGCFNRQCIPWKD